MVSESSMTISQLARAADTSVYVVRNYALAGLLECHQSPRNGYNLYDEHALQRVRLIRTAIDAGLLLNEIKPLIQAMRGHNSAEMEAVIKALHRKVRASQQRLKALDKLLDLVPEQQHKYVSTT